MLVIAHYNVHRGASIEIQFTLRGRNDTQWDWPVGRWGEVMRKYKHTWKRTEKLTGEAPSINQMTEVNDSSPPDHNGCDEQRENSKPFRPIILRRDPKHSQIALLRHLELSCWPWIRNRNPRKPDIVCLSRSRNYKVLGNVEIQPGVLTKIFLIRAIRPEPNFVRKDVLRASLTNQFTNRYLLNSRIRINTL